MSKAKAVFLFVGLVAIILSGRAFPSAPPTIPTRLITVGVVHPISAGSAWIEERLKSNGYSVRLVESEPSNFQGFFATNADIDFVIVPFSDPGAKIAMARIYQRETLYPVSLQRSGDQALPDLGDAIVEFLSTPRAIWSVAHEKEKSLLDAKSRLPAQAFRADMFKAQQLMDAGNYSAAIEELGKALAMEPADDQVHYNLAFCYKHIGDKGRMLYHAKEAHAINPLNSAVNILLGNDYLSNGQLQLAIAAYKSALPFPPTRSIANWNLAVAYGKTGDVEKVKKHLGAISTSAAEYENAQAWLATMDESERKAAGRIRLIGILGVAFFAATTALLIFIVVRQLRRALTSKVELRVEMATAIIGGLFTILSSLLTWIYGRW